MVAFSGKELPMLIGNLTSICVGGLVCVIVSLVQTKQRGGCLSNETWELTRDIDSPLSPWTELYATYVYAVEWNISSLITNLDSDKYMYQSFYHTLI